MSRKKIRNTMINLLTALAISLVVNFSNFVFMLSAPSTAPEQQIVRSFYSSPAAHTLLQVVFYFLLGFILLSIATSRISKYKDNSGFILRVVLCLLVAVLFYFLAPKMLRDGSVILQIHARRLLDPTVILRCSLTLVVALLYGKIYDLIYQKQNITYENEVLKNQNLQATYNSLVTQINPHFFFNSLNSLSMLVREKKNDKALDYINRLSDSFRYIIKSGQAGMGTLEEEMDFLNAYSYMLDIRYDGKIFFETDIDPKYRNWLLPTLSLQPLLENAVKHNSITKSDPLRITIRASGDSVIVSNPRKPKITKYECTGTGLANLAARYELLTGKSITITETDDIFEVSLPLTPIE